MFASFLITFREVLEASFIVATVLGILLRIGARESVRVVWRAVGLAVLVSILFVVGGGFIGLRVQEWYSGRTEELVEGILMIGTAAFITWAVFFLHNFFARRRGRIHEKVHEGVANGSRGLFALVFVSVFREGFEITLFLSSLIFSVASRDIAFGFVGGAVIALLFALIFFVGTRQFPIAYAVHGTNFLLILFAAGLLGRGVHEFIEAGLLPFLERLPDFSLVIIPNAKTTFIGGFLKSMFGITATMHSVQIAMYGLYVIAMVYAVFVRLRYVSIAMNTSANQAKSIL